jgi:N-acetylmuramate 1-kinase
MSDAGNFLRKAGWGEAQIFPLQSDASTRRYARLINGARRAMLMDQPQAAESAVAGPDTDEKNRRALGYNALARLAGADCRRFAAVANYLSARDLSAPKILAADYGRGLLVLEDLGDALFTDVLPDGASSEELYKAAVEVLARLHSEAAPSVLALEAHQATLPLFVYDEIALIAETDLMLEWFLPLAMQRPATETEYREHRALWKAALDAIASKARVFVHRDYHAQNLIWLPERQGLARVGLIDFQDAVAGSRAYDLISLIEDARRDVPAELAEISTRHYLAATKRLSGELDENAFRAEMALMAAQRNTKIVGIFARLASRDGKRRYLDYLPRVWGYLEQDLRHPRLASLRHWYDHVLPQTRRSLPERATA